MISACITIGILLSLIIFVELRSHKKGHAKTMHKMVEEVRNHAPERRRQIDMLERIKSERRSHERRVS